MHERNDISHNHHNHCNKVCIVSPPVDEDRTKQEKPRSHSSKFLQLRVVQEVHVSKRVEVHEDLLEFGLRNGLRVSL